ncbi:3'-5' exonuclease eri1 [Leucoagaricus sp. SymC.cos]|nr:3'-5' exonuclease eri1 [Leucoagaricus sp. SymC.cos]
MRYTLLPPDLLPDPRHRRPQSPSPFRVQQPYDAFLILDVEATCFQGTDFNYPNEIIEFPICLMKWQDRDRAMKASKLQVVDEFRSFVRPSWRPTLSGFCTELTGITQEQVDAAPLFPDVLKSVRAFLVKNGLIDDATGKRLVRFCWCSDGPFDVRDFVVKQCFISKISMPEWLTGDILDVRMTVMQWLNTQVSHSTTTPNSTTRTFPPVRRSLNIPAQLKALGLPTFQGRQHSGIDDTRNIAKIVTELGKRGVSLKPNTQIKPGRKWIWMGKGGEVLEQFCASFDENGKLASLPSPPRDHSWSYPATPQPWISSASTGSESESSSGQTYGFGTATRPGSPAFWQPPRRPDSPMSIVSISSSPESESEFGVRIAKPGAARFRRGHKRMVTAGPLTMGVVGGNGVGIDIAVGAAAACVS